MDRLLGRYSDYIFAMARIVVAFLFMQHGLMKLFGMFGGIGESGGTVALFLSLGAAGVIETFGGLLISLGLYGSHAAFLASGLMAAAYFMGHAPRGFWPILNGGELAVLYCFFLLYVAARSSGPWSLNRALGRS